MKKEVLDLIIENTEYKECTHVCHFNTYNYGGVCDACKNCLEICLALEKK